MESENRNNLQEMPGEGHHAMYRLSLYQNILLEVLLDPFTLLYIKQSKHSNRAVTIST